MKVGSAFSVTYELKALSLDRDFSISNSVLPSSLHTLASRQTKFSKHVKNGDKQFNL